MKQAWSTKLLQTTGVILTLLAIATSQGVTQSLSYVQGVALQTSYTPPTLPFTVKAVYGDFHNRSPLWVQLWKQAADEFTYALQWQVKVTPEVGDGQGEWMVLGEESQVTLGDNDKLGLVNDVIPGPLLQRADVTQHILLSVDDVIGRGTDEFDLEVGQEITYDDLAFPYHIPLYLCNTSDCIYVRVMLGRAELPMGNETTAAIHSTRQPITAAPARDVSDEDDGPPLAVWLWLACLSLVLLLILLCLACLCALMSRRHRREEAYRYAAHLNPAYSSISSLSTKLQPHNHSNGCLSGYYSTGHNHASANKGPYSNGAFTPGAINASNNAGQNNALSNTYTKAVGSALHYTLPNVHSSLIKLPTTNSFRNPHTASSSTLTAGSGVYVAGRLGPVSRDGNMRSHLSSTTRGVHGSGYVSNISRDVSNVSRDIRRNGIGSRLSRDNRGNGQTGSSSRDMHVGSASSGMAEFEDTDSFESVSSAYYNSRVIKF